MRSKEGIACGQAKTSIETEDNRVVLSLGGGVGLWGSAMWSIRQRRSMGRFASCFVLVSLLTGIMPALAKASESLVYLQDWESGTAGWTSKHGGAVVLAKRADAPSPPTVQKIARRDSDGDNFSPLIPMSGGAFYCFSAWIKWAGGGWPFVGFDNYNADGSFVGTTWVIGRKGYKIGYGGGEAQTVTPVPASVKGWKKYQKTIYVGSSIQQVRLKNELWDLDSKPGNDLALFDDLRIQARPCQSDPVDQSAFLSGTGDSWLDPEQENRPYPATLSFGHDGCRELDHEAHCASGVWPRVGAGRWIWKSATVTPEEASEGATVVFQKEISLSRNLPLSIELSADDKYFLYWNGNFVGENFGWETSETWPLEGEEGSNLLRIAVMNNSHHGGPLANPAGLAYQIHPRFEQQHDFTLTPPNPGQDDSHCYAVARRRYLCREVRGIEELGHEQTYWIAPSEVQAVSGDTNRYGREVKKKRSSDLYEGCYQLSEADGYYCDYKAVGIAAYNFGSGKRFWLPVLRDWAEYYGPYVAECAVTVMSFWGSTEGSGQPLAEIVEACGKEPFQP